MDIEKNQKIVFIIPVFNEEGTIESTIQEIQNVFPKSDIILVNDGSRDKTQSIIEKLNAEVVSLPFNVGKGAALQTGIKYVLSRDYELFVQLDGDGQHIAEETNKIIAPLLEGSFDIVIGSRRLDNNDFKFPFFKKMAISLFSFLLGRKIKDPTSGFRAFNRRAIQNLIDIYPYDYPEVETIEIARLKNLRISEVPVLMRKRQGGQSAITFTEAVYFMIKVPIAIVTDKMRAMK